MAGLLKSQIYLIDVPQEILGDTKPPLALKSVSQIAEAGKLLPPAEIVYWGSGEAARRTAFLCYSSGTSGLPVSPDPLSF